MKGKQLSVNEVKAMESGSKVYRVDRVTQEINLEYVARGTYFTKTVGVEEGTNEFRYITDQYLYFEYTKGISVGVLEEITFDTIRYAVSTCKFKNEQQKRLGNPELFPGIDEAYRVLNEIAANSRVEGR